MPPASFSSFLFSNEPALAFALVDDRVLVVFVTRHVMDLLACGVTYVALDVAAELDLYRHKLGRRLVLAGAGGDPLCPDRNTGTRYWCFSCHGPGADPRGLSAHMRKFVSGRPCVQGIRTCSIAACSYRLPRRNADHKYDGCVLNDDASGQFPQHNSLSFTDSR